MWLVGAFKQALIDYRYLERRCPSPLVVWTRTPVAACPHPNFLMQSNRSYEVLNLIGGVFEDYIRHLPRPSAEADPIDLPLPWTRLR